MEKGKVQELIQSNSHPHMKWERTEVLRNSTRQNICGRSGEQLFTSETDTTPTTNKPTTVLLATVSKNFKINLEGQNYVHFYVILSRNANIFGIMASL